MFCGVCCKTEPSTYRSTIPQAPSDSSSKKDSNKGQSTRRYSSIFTLILYVVAKYPNDAKQILEKLVNKIYRDYKLCKLKVNADKCETILVRLSTLYLSNPEQVGWKKFQIKIEDPDTKGTTKILHRRSVKYLGVQIDDLLRMNAHPEVQLEKARRAFMAHGNYFYNRHLSNRVKLICYCLLVRSILTYAFPIWFNQSASVMERICVFERACLRACTGLYLSEHSRYKRSISNAQLYEAVNIPRIDCFAIKLCKEYFANNPKITDNEIINSLAECEANYAEKCKARGNVPPQCFINFDAQGLIQDGNNVPVIYH